MKKLFFLLSLLSSSTLFAQGPASYVKPTDTAVLAGLENWQDWKFGLLMHWGPYAQWGVVESWSICPEDEDWCKRSGAYGYNYNAYRRNYEALGNTFNPTKFDPTLWANLAKEAGMKYVVFTTKHHDGFCMFDTKFTDYKITSLNSPYKRDITADIFTAFRSQGFGVGAYFSKPDWHSNDYWWDYFPPKDRNTNYDPKRYQDRWNAFTTYTHNQLLELTGGKYGKIDILWLDGGWVRPANSIDTSIVWQRTIPWEQNVHLEAVERKLRFNNPRMLIVDRSVGGPFENYQTPEQEVPEHTLNHPWETCMTMGSSWSYNARDGYKSSKKLVQTLVKVVAKGGNFLLNVGPSPEGTLHDTAIARLHDIGAWMKINSTAIYGTRPIAPYQAGNVAYTSKTDNFYAIVLADSTDKLPAFITISLPDHQCLANGIQSVKLLGFSGSVKWKRSKDGKSIMVQFPKEAIESMKNGYAWTIEVK